LSHWWFVDPLADYQKKGIRIVNTWSAGDFTLSFTGGMDDDLVQERFFGWLKVFDIQKRQKGFDSQPDA